VSVHKESRLKTGVRYGVRLQKYLTVDGKRSQRCFFLGNYASPAEAEEIKIRALELIEVQALTGEEVRNKINSEAAGTRTRRLRANYRSSVKHLYEHQQELVNNRTFHVTNLGKLFFFLFLTQISLLSSSFFTAYVVF
jgi:hypothetical protein